MQLKFERFEWLPVVRCHGPSTLDENRSIVLKIWSVVTLRSICVVSKHCSVDILSNFEYHLSHFCLFLYPKWVNKNILKCPNDQHRVRYTCIIFWIYLVPMFSQRPINCLRFFFVSSVILGKSCDSIVTVFDYYLFCIILLLKLC